MREMKMQPLFKAQALNKMQVRLAVLHAILASLVGRELRKGIGVTENAVFFKQLFDDLLHAHMLKNALIRTMRKVGNMWHQRQAIVT